ncbi:YjjW family glycine radical enzyme activase [Clostridium fungisolvens]|uniref:Glycyl-radical enzyme activating enzyme YjjW n=1 Tax=Clostridium fungisolvens TaxID=1604897 RepID=A0A6V8SEN8_9CLOT|nr:YjjW family glycine radical enzyme activase [Clostridium fungisolvens]GFP75699.1 Putative glycyl-radical enzyme activating enzyme YjjW [Clostridium fungisolvens]
METKVPVNKIIPFSNVDGPGNRLAIFFQGCNISCVYCHNPETINLCSNCKLCAPGCPVKAIKEADGKVVFNDKLCVECDKCIKTCKTKSSPRTKNYSVDELIEIIEEYKLFIRGITVSGGEPTLKAPFIAELFKKVKSLGLTCFVDTNGFFEKDSISELIEVTDKFMVDIKAIDKLETLCDTKMKNNLDNLKYLLSIDKVYEVRTVLIEDLMDLDNTVVTVANILKAYPEVIYKLIRVHTEGLKDDQKEKIKDKIPTKERMNYIEKLVRGIGVEKVEIIDTPII